MCQRDNNSTKEQTTAEGQQQVFNAAKNAAGLNMFMRSQPLPIPLANAEK